MYHYQACQVARCRTSLGAAQVAQDLLWSVFSNLLQQREVPPPHWRRNGTDDSSEQTHRPMAGSGAVAAYRDRMSQLITRLLKRSRRCNEIPRPSQGGRCWGSRSRAATEPPPFHPHSHITSPAGKSSSFRALVAPRLSRRFQRQLVQQVRPFISFLTRFWSS